MFVDRHGTPEHGLLKSAQWDKELNSLWLERSSCLFTLAFGRTSLFSCLSPPSKLHVTLRVSCKPFFLRTV